MNRYGSSTSGVGQSIRASRRRQRRIRMAYRSPCALLRTFHYAGEALESKTAGRDWRFYWNGTPSNGRPVRKNHGSLQTGWERYRNDYTGAQDGSEVLLLLQQAHQIRIAADYSFATDFTRDALDLLVITTQDLVAIIDGS